MSRTVLESRVITNRHVAEVAVRGLQGVRGKDGKDGVIFYPAVEEGELSWTNNGGLDNPAPVSILGPQGIKGDTGATGPTGPQGPQGVTFTPYVTDDGELGFTNNGGLDNPELKSVKGPKGDRGEPGIGYTCDEFVFESTGLTANTTVELNQVDGTTFQYTVGHNQLRVIVDGLTLVRGKHYEEVGSKDELSSKITFLTNVPEGALVDVWASSLGAGETAVAALSTEQIESIFW